MLNSIVKRHSKLNPLNDTGIKIVRSATKLFLQNGFSNTTFKMIEEDSGIKVGAITYYFRTKEDMLFLLIEELLDYHADILEGIHSEIQNNLLAYAIGIAVKLALCEQDRNAWDLYYSGYTHPVTYECIKTWAAEKNYNLLKDRLPDWTEHDFRDKEIVASGIEFAALKTFCDRSFTLDKKVSIILDGMMMLYEISKEERQKVIDKVLELDYENTAKEMFNEFVKRLDNDVKKIG